MLIYLVSVGGVKNTVTNKVTGSALAVLDVLFSCDSLNGRRSGGGQADNWAGWEAGG